MILALTGALTAAGCDGGDERHGALTLLWVRGDASPFGERARDCLL